MSSNFLMNSGDITLSYRNGKVVLVLLILNLNKKQYLKACKILTQYIFPLHRILILSISVLCLFKFPFVFMHLKHKISNNITLTCCTFSAMTLLELSSSNSNMHHASHVPQNYSHQGRLSSSQIWATVICCTRLFKRINVK